jgi:TetR/AcrR family transcriptional regulator, fatty acid metabolism regulator protein
VSTAGRKESAPARRPPKGAQGARRARGRRIGAGANGPVDKRRAILDAAVGVFARQGFHACRVADVADEAGVAYGLVYHYFASKDEILDTLFLERWAIMLGTIRQVDSRDMPAREKLRAIAAFIIDSYSHDPDLMKVIIVEVTRAANSFGQTHLAQIREAFTLISEIVTSAQEIGEFKPDINAEFASIAFYGAIEQVLTGWIFGLLPDDEAHYELAKRQVIEIVCGGLEGAPAGASPPRRGGTRTASASTVRKRASSQAPGASSPAARASSRSARASAPGGTASPRSNKLR